jgi:hypothetical protein
MAMVCDDGTRNLRHTAIAAARSSSADPAPIRRPPE